MKTTKNILAFILLPLQIFLPESILRRFKIRTLKDIRIGVVLMCCRGRLLDIGCGKNELVRLYKNGIGCDIKQWGEVDLVCDPASLPFPDRTYDTITFVACLNHIINRKNVLLEAKRCLKNDGQIIITMINPVIGWLCHKLEWINWDLEGAGLKKEELPGMSTQMMLDLLKSTGLKMISHRKFLFGFNNIYLVGKLK